VVAVAQLVPLFWRNRVGKPLAKELSRRKGDIMAKSSKRDRTEGVVDRVGGTLLELVGKLTGNRKQKAKGKAGRVRGRARTRKGRAKSRVKRATR
jgi:uncharacterized protein YjbJ (UPF0337 family)